MIPGARSYKGGQVPRDEVLAAIARTTVDYKQKALRAGLDEIEDYDGDIFVVAGDLHIAGDLDLHKEGVYLLVVLGDLVVDGYYADLDDPESWLLVTGSMRARDIVTAGWLEVHGAVTTNRLIGDYNDCAAHLRGDVSAQLFYGEEHHFTIGGELRVPVVLGRPRLDIQATPDAIPLTDARVLEHIDRALLRTYDDEDDDGNPIVGLDGIADFRELKKRVRAGLPLKTA